MGMSMSMSMYKHIRQPRPRLRESAHTCTSFNLKRLNNPKDVIPHEDQQTYALKSRQNDMGSHSIFPHRLLTPTMPIVLGKAPPQVSWTPIVHILLFVFQNRSENPE